MAQQERFSQRARRVLSLAHQEAERFRNNKIGAEHLLLGLILEEGGVAGRVLRELGFTYEPLREVTSRVTIAQTEDFDPNKIELGPDSQQTLENAVEEARRLGQNYISTEHILLGLVRQENTALDVLRRLGTTPEQIRRQTRRILQEDASNSVNVKSTKNSALARRFTVDGMAVSDLYSYEDFLGYKDYVDALASFIESPKTRKPLTIGIDAPWGGGKTTLMRMLERRLSGRKQSWWKKTRTNVLSFRRSRLRQPAIPLFKTVWFDAWLYDKEEALWAAMALEIWSQVAHKISFFERFLLTLKMNSKRVDWNNLLISILKASFITFVLAAFGYLCFLGLSFWLGKDIYETLDWVRQYIKVFAGLGLVAVSYTVVKDFVSIINSPLKVGIARYLRSPDYSAKIGFIREFQYDYKYIVESITQRGKWPLVVFIDDLDRCTPDKAAEVIEAINLLLDTEYSVFVIGMDTNMLSKSIQAKYKDLQPFFAEMSSSDHRDIGRHFLEKIVQIDFHIPRPDDTYIQKFIKAQLGKPVPSTEEQSNKQVAVSLIQAEKRSGKSQEEAEYDVKRARPDLMPVIQDAARTVRESSFEDSIEVEQVITAMAVYLDYNPRRIKRFINIYRLQALIAYQRGLLGKSITLINLAYWIVISMRWPDFIDLAVKQPLLLNYLRFDAKRIKGSTVETYNGVMENVKQKYPPSLFRLIANEDFRKLITLVTGETNEVQHYLQLSQLNVTT